MSLVSLYYQVHSQMWKEWGSVNYARLDFSAIKLNNLRALNPVKLENTLKRGHHHVLTAQPAELDLQFLQIDKVINAKRHVVLVNIVVLDRLFALNAKRVDIAVMLLQVVSCVMPENSIMKPVQLLKPNAKIVP